eukprot:Lankesteria_metandrocarpae@DN4901_c0_g1_i1.p2
MKRHGIIRADALFDVSSDATSDATTSDAMSNRWQGESTTQDNKFNSDTSCEGKIRIHNSTTITSTEQVELTTQPDSLVHHQECCQSRECLHKEDSSQRPPELADSADSIAAPQENVSEVKKDDNDTHVLSKGSTASASSSWSGTSPRRRRYAMTQDSLTNRCQSRESVIEDSPHYTSAQLKRSSDERCNKSSSATATSPQLPLAPPPPSSSSTTDPTNSNDSSNSSRGYFECNICFDDAKNPVVTKCGHLFCWLCLHGWIRRGDMDVVECPVCKAAVSKTTVIPLYGRGSDNVDPRTKNCETPQRPRPERTEAPSSSRGRNHQFNGLSSFSFGVFPFGFGFAIGTDGRPHIVHPPQQQGGVNMRGEQINQAVSTLWFAIGLFLMLYFIFFN